MVTNTTAQTPTRRTRVSLISSEILMCPDKETESEYECAWGTHIQNNLKLERTKISTVKIITILINAIAEKERSLLVLFKLRVDG